MAGDGSGLTHSHLVARLRLPLMEDAMKAQPAPDNTRAGLTEPRTRRSGRRPDLDAAVLTDEEAFYAAQEEAFADMRARNLVRPRRKL